MLAIFILDNEGASQRTSTLVEKPLNFSMEYFFVKEKEITYEDT